MHRQARRVQQRAAGVGQPDEFLEQANRHEPIRAEVRPHWRPILKSKTKLSTSMTLTEFDNGYWYATELKEFAEEIGIPSAAKLRKDELEKAIKLYLATGKIENPTTRSLSTSGVKDVE